MLNQINPIESQVPEAPGLFGNMSVGKTAAFVPMVATSVVTSTLNSVGGLLGWVAGAATGEDYSEWGQIVNSQEMWDSISPTMGDYYSEMSGTVEAWGFIGSMFVGGLGAVKGLNAAAKASKGLAGLKNLDTFSDAFKAFNIKANIVQQGAIVRAVNSAVSGEIALTKALPKASMIGRAMATGASEALAFEIGAFATTNQNITYNPEQLAASDALQQNLGIHALGIGLGVVINPVVHYFEAVGGAKKLLGKYTEVSNKIVQDTSKAFAEGLTPSERAFRAISDASKLPQLAQEAKAKLPSFLSPAGIDKTVAQQANALDMQAIETLKFMVKGDEEEKVKIAKDMLDLFKRRAQNPDQMESMLNNEAGVASMLAGTANFRPLEEVDRLLFASQKAETLDNIGIRYYGDVAQQHMSKIGEFQITEQGFVKANYNSGVAGVFRDFHALNAEEQIDAFEAVISKFAADDVYKFEETLINSPTPVIAVRNIVGGAKKVVEASDPTYLLLRDIRDNVRWFNKKSTLKGLKNETAEVMHEARARLNNLFNFSLGAEATPIIKSFNKAMRDSGDIMRMLDLENAGSWKVFDDWIEAETKRLYDPREIMGRAIQILEDTPDVVKGISSRLYNSLTKNRLLAESYSKSTRAVRNIETGELVLGGVHAVIGDFGVVKLVGDTVTAGKVAYTITRSPQTFQELAQLDSVLASAHWAKAQLKPTVIMDGMKIGGEDIITASSVHSQLQKMAVGEQQKALSGLTFNGKYFARIEEFEKELIQQKQAAIEFLADVPKTAAERELWGMDRIQRMVGAGDNFLQDAKQVNPMNWDKAKHVTERRLRDGNWEMSEADAMAHMEEMWNTRQVQLAEALNALPPQMRSVIESLADPQVIDQLAYKMKSEGVASMLKFANPNDPISMFALQTGETLSAYQRQLAATLGAVHRTNYEAVVKAGKTADVFAIIHAAQQAKGLGDGLKGIKVAVTQEMMNANPYLKQALINAGFDAAGTIEVPILAKLSQIAKAGDNPTELVMNALRNDQITQGAITVDKDVYKFLDTFQQNFNKRIRAGNAQRAAKNQRAWNVNDAWYFPPHLAEHSPHTAFIHLQGVEGQTMQMVFGATREELERNVAHVQSSMAKRGMPGAQVFYRQDAKEWSQLLNKTGWNHTMDFGDRIADVSMTSKGVYQGMQPRFTLSYLDDLLKWDMNQEVNLLRETIATRYSTTFHLLDHFGKVDSKIQESIAGSIAGIKKEAPMSAFTKLRNTALNLPSETSDWWMRMQKAGEAALAEGYYSLRKVVQSAPLKSMGTTDAGVTVAQANDVIRRYGLQLPYDGVEQFVINNSDMPKDIALKAMQKLNQVAVLGQLTLDTAHKIVNIISTPIRLMPALQSLSKQMAEGVQDGFTQASIASVNGQLPSPLRAMTKAVAETFSPERAAWRQEAIKRGILKDMDSELMQLAGDSLSIPRTGSLAYINSILERSQKFFNKWTTTNVVESWTREIAAKSAYDIAKDAAKAGLISEGEVWLQVTKVVNQIHGTQLAAARPGIFHGPLGVGATLFQTYQLTQLQQVVRYMEEGDKKAIATLFGLQGAVFGLQGMPGFDQVNEYFAGENAYKQDLYGKMYKQLGVQDGDLMLYGLGSAPLNLALYNRGDVSPRFATIIPTDIADFPAINLAKQLVGSIYGTATKAARNGLNGQTLLEGVVASGFNRPMKLLAGNLMGMEVTKSGTGAMPVEGIDLLSWTTYAHALGARTMNEAVARDMMYRSDNYKIKQREKLQSLAGDFKTTIRAGDVSSDYIQDMAERYASVGGDLKNFNSWMLRQYQNASPASIIGLTNNTQTRKYQNVMEMMGARGMDDFEKNLRNFAFDYRGQAIEAQSMSPY